MATYGTPPSSKKACVSPGNLVGQLLSNLSEELVALLQPFLEKKRLTNKHDAEELGVEVLDYLLKKNKTVKESRSASIVVENNFKKYKTSHTKMDCPAGLNPEMPPLEEATFDQLARKIQWYEWKAFVETDKGEKKELRKELKELREKEKEQLQHEKEKEQLQRQHEKEKELRQKEEAQLQRQHELAMKRHDQGLPIKRLPSTLTFPQAKRVSAIGKTPSLTTESQVKQNSLKFKTLVYGVKWQQSTHKFCKGQGSSWKYQESELIKTRLKVALLQHYKWSGFPQVGDKTTHPLFFICCGAGTGKSRLLDEFQRLCCDVTTPEVDLHNRLKQAFVFKVDFENGTAGSDRFRRPMHYITSRMYWQVISPRVEWEVVSSSSFHHLTFTEIVEQLAISEAMVPKDMTIIVLVDGLHKLEHSKGSRSSIFYSVLNTLADWSNNSGKDNKPFVIVCASSTVEEPIQDFLSPTRQRREFLLPPKLDGTTIIQPKNDTERLMVSDMGGHGYALELLQESLHKYRDGNWSPSVLMSEIRSSLMRTYRGWNDPTMQLDVLQCLLLGQKFQSLQSPLGSSTVDDYQKLGLVRWDPATKVLECPFVWLQIMSENIPELRDIARTGCALETVEAHTTSSVPTYTTWQHWEDFVTRYWCFKTSVLNGQTVTWQKLHNGAFFQQVTSRDNPEFVVKKLKLVTALHHGMTNSTMKGEIVTHEGKITPSGGNHHILSAYGNPAGDSFCFLPLTTPVVFSISCKSQVTARSISDYEEEHYKATKGCNDFFIEYSLSKYPSFTTNDLPNGRCGLVCEDNFESYFGPYSGRAFIMKNITLPNINYASKVLLQSVDGIGSVIIENILTARDQKRIRNMEDAIERIDGLGKKKAKLFIYDEH